MESKLKEGILQTFADHANLPDRIDDIDKKNFNEKPTCELCDRKFNKFNFHRHHCRKCYKSVCDRCSANTRKLAKLDDTLYRVCDYCDT